MHHEQHKTVFELLARAQLLEQFLAQQYRGTKRLGLADCEVLIVALNSIIERVGLLGTGCGHGHVAQRSHQCIGAELTTI